MNELRFLISDYDSFNEKILKKKVTLARFYNLISKAYRKLKKIDQAHENLEKSYVLFRECLGNENPIVKKTEKKCEEMKKRRDFPTNLDNFFSSFKNLEKDEFNENNTSLQAELEKSQIKSRRENTIPKIIFPNEEDQEKEDFVMNISKIPKKSVKLNVSEVNCDFEAKNVVRNNENYDLKTIPIKENSQKKKPWNCDTNSKIYQQKKNGISMFCNIIIKFFIIYKDLSIFYKAVLPSPIVLKKTIVHKKTILLIKDLKPAEAKNHLKELLHHSYALQRLEQH